MSTVVGDIHSAIKTLAASVLGASYQELKHIYAPEKNDLRNIKSAYGVIHGAASYADGVTRVYTMDQEFTLVLVKRAIRRDSDDDLQTVINELYNKADDFLVQSFLTKLSLSSTVLIVDQPAISEPEILDNECVLIRVSFNVKYRKAIA